MGIDTAGVCREQPFIDRRRLAFRHGDTILRGLPDDPGFGRSGAPKTALTRSFKPASRWTLTGAVSLMSGSGPCIRLQFTTWYL